MFQGGYSFSHDTLQHDFNETVDDEALRFQHNGIFDHPKRYEAQFSPNYPNTLKGMVCVFLMGLSSETLKRESLH